VLSAAYLGDKVHNVQVATLGALYASIQAGTAANHCVQAGLVTVNLAQEISDRVSGVLVDMHKHRQGRA
jgi:hypothetical protein